MKNQRRKIVVICGPTATGKTSLGLQFCQNFNGEIVSIDSRQVYKKLEIGVGKLPLSSNELASFSSRHVKLADARTWQAKEAGTSPATTDGGSCDPRGRHAQRGCQRKQRALKAVTSSEGERKVQGTSRIEKKDGFWIINGVKVHLYDLISPDQELNAVQYARLAADRVEKIWSRGKVPFWLVGLAFI